MNSSPKYKLNRAARPTAVSVIAWVWIILGVFMAFGGIFGLLMSSIMPPIPSQEEFRPQMPAGFGFMMGMFKHFSLLALVQLVVSALAISAGIQLLKLRSWARTTIEILSWLIIVYTVGFGIFWLLMWSSMTVNIPQQGASIDMDKFRMIGLILGSIIILTFAVPFGIMIMYLRGSTVRDAIQKVTSSQV